MQVAENRVVTLDYTLTDLEGEVIDSSEEGGPLAYIHGCGELLEGLESALDGKSVDEEFQVILGPDEAYGRRDEELISVLGRTDFEGVADIEVGMQFEAEMEEGQVVLTVVNVDGDEITVDANHPLADLTLNFNVKVLEVRDATEEELQHGHVHGPGGHSH